MNPASAMLKRPKEGLKTADQCFHSSFDIPNSSLRICSSSEHFCVSPSICLNHPMKKLVLASLAVFTSAAFAQTGTYNAEYERLQKDYVAATKQALDPVKKRHIDALQQLIRKATQAGDLETAVKVKEALEHLAPAQTGSTRNATTGASKRALLMANMTSSKWAVFDTPTQKRIDTQIFNPDGTCTGRFNGKWEVISIDSVQINANAQTYVGTFNEEGTQIEFARIQRTLRKEKLQ
jgi:hypothetical protein